MSHSFLFDEGLLAKVRETQQAYYAADAALLEHLEPLVEAFVKEHGSAALFEEMKVLPECITRFALWQKYAKSGA